MTAPPIPESGIAEVSYTVPARDGVRDLHVELTLPAGAHLVAQSPDARSVAANEVITGMVHVWFPPDAASHMVKDHQSELDAAFTAWQMPMHNDAWEPDNSGAAGTPLSFGVWSPVHTLYSAVGAPGAPVNVPATGGTYTVEVKSVCNRPANCIGPDPSRVGIGRIGPEA